MCHNLCPAQWCVCRPARLCVHGDRMQICSESTVLFFALLLSVGVWLIEGKEPEKNRKVGHIDIVCYFNCYIRAALLSKLMVMFSFPCLIKALCWWTTGLVLHHTTHSCTLDPAHFFFKFFLAYSDILNELHLISFRLVNLLSYKVWSIASKPKLWATFPNLWFIQSIFSHDFLSQIHTTEADFGRAAQITVKSPSKWTFSLWCSFVAPLLTVFGGYILVELNISFWQTILFHTVVQGKLERSLPRIFCLFRNAANRLCNSL